MKEHKTKVVATTEEMDLVRSDLFANSRFEFRQHAKKMVTQRAALAATLIEKWGMVACTGEGEDSAGRQRLRLLSPEEVVVRACDTADIAFTEFDARGWRVDLPGYDDIHAQGAEGEE
ncbi:hypothetical protein OIU35_31670 [Boseaceae bacterium BT-24-1]|nr:hypothetical protein [Boseaceae bacterium BT-24-1]